MGQVFYTDAEIATIRSMRAQKKSLAAIGIAIGRTRDSVASKVRHLKIGPLSDFTERQKNWICKQWLARKTAPEIARKLKSTVDRVRYVIHKRKLKDPKIVTDEQKQTIALLYKAGSSVTEIAIAVNHPASTVGSQLRKMKLWSRRWYTRKDLKRLRQMHREGKATEEIAAELKRSVEAVEKKLSDLGLYKQKYTKAQERLMRKLKRQGLTARQIAKQIPDRSASQIRSKLRSMGLSTNKDRQTAASRLANRFTDEQHDSFCDFLRHCTKREFPVPVHEIMLLWNRDAATKKVPRVTIDKVEYWLKKLRLPVITGKKVKKESPLAYKRRQQIKLATVHRNLEERDAKARVELRKLQAKLMRKRPKPKTFPCPRCPPKEKPWPLTADFFEAHGHKSGRLILETGSCKLCLKQRERRIAALKANGASAEEIEAFRRADNLRTLERRRVLGTSNKGKLGLR